MLVRSNFEKKYEYLKIKYFFHIQKYSFQPLNLQGDDYESARSKRDPWIHEGMFDSTNK